MRIFVVNYKRIIADSIVEISHQNDYRALPLYVARLGTRSSEGKV